MENPQGIIRPTVRPDTGLKVKIPSTPEGKQFLEDLKRLLKVEDLPFEKVCTSAPTHAEAQASAPVHLEAQAAPAKTSGSTTYTLDLRLEQEGWAP